MEYSGKLTGITLYIQEMDIDKDDNIKEAIRKSISRIAGYHDQIQRVDVYPAGENGKATEQKTSSIKLGIPGNTHPALLHGNNFYSRIINVEEKIMHAVGEKMTI